MINRRSTPSGDGRGRGRTGGSGRSAGRGGRPAFRSDRDDSRSGSRDDFRGGARRDDRDRGYGRDSAGDARPSRDSLRADRSGTRSRYGRPGDGREDRNNAPADRDSRSRGDRDDRYSRGDREDRYPRGDRPEASRGEREGYRSDRPRDERGGYGAQRRDDRGAYGGDRRGERGGYGAARRDERGGYGAARRDERGGYGAARRDERGGYGAARRDERGGYGADRRDERGASGGDRRGERGGYGADRGGFRADRTGRRDTDRTGRGRTTDSSGRGDREARYTGRDGREAGYAGRDGREAGYTGRDGREAPRPSRGGAEDFGPRAEASTRARYGRRDGDGRTAARDARTGGRAPRRDDVQTVGKSYGSPQRDRIKAARQPIRDRDLYPEGYTDERDTTEVPNGVRLQKVLAQAGVASRRACEEMIGEGRVTVNGQVVRRFGAKVDPATQVIHVDGKRIPTAPDLVYYALNKPIGVVSTMDDPQGRPCLADFVQELAPRLFHVGRLDTETEGLLLLTNDGELANRLTHPSYGVQKKYWAKVPGPIPRDLGRRLKQGIELEDGLARADSFSIVQEHGQQALVEIVLHEGRKHVVRRMLEEAGHRVIDLARIEFGPVKLGRTKPGTVRALSLKEVGELYAAVKL
ncbi:23S rRNA pseudouridine2605 synthase [Nonomuraea polychroma]|uniref:Pseudouridine synthase n=1 Tax=Nonomuraea polychroma TaxID=46176 RepID=A0A438M1D4_9ACTN|nr:pseudouridine synthase [Nonomuraea polychroma]RVX39644.1 23S rRNA pseudouridine2605 synthase [Nonomuraea polychroma]